MLIKLLNISVYVKLINKDPSCSLAEVNIKLAMWPSKVANCQHFSFQIMQTGVFSLYDFIFKLLLIKRSVWKPNEGHYAKLHVCVCVCGVGLIKFCWFCVKEGQLTWPHILLKCAHSLCDDVISKDDLHFAEDVSCLCLVVTVTPSVLFVHLVWI